MYYRLDLPDRALTIIGDEIMDEIKFQIGDYTLMFDESIVPYMNISQDIDEVAKPLIKELGEQYKSLGNIAAVHNQFLSIGNEALEKVAEQAVKIFSECGIYDVNANKILNATDFHVSPLNLWANYFSQIDNIYVRIEQRSIAEKDARELQKETRMRVVGGGFGLSGAAKGMVQAGAINMLTGAAYDFVNMFGDMQSDKAASKSKEALYESLDTLYTLQLGFSAATNVIKQIVFKILRIKPFEDNNVEQATAILKMFIRGIYRRKTSKRQLYKHCYQIHSMLNYIGHTSVVLGTEASSWKEWLNFSGCLMLFVRKKRVFCYRCWSRSLVAIS